MKGAAYGSVLCLYAAVPWRKPVHGDDQRRGAADGHALQRQGRQVHPGTPTGGFGGTVALRGQDNGVATGIRHQGEADPWAEGNACRRAGEDRGVVSRASRRGGNDAARGEGISNFCKSNVSAVTGNDKIGIFSQNALDKPEILAIMKLSAEVPLLLRFNED